jgi:hypothetical protein
MAPSSNYAASLPQPDVQSFLTEYENAPGTQSVVVPNPSTPGILDIDLTTGLNAPPLVSYFKTINNDYRGNSQCSLYIDPSSNPVTIHARKTTATFTPVKYDDMFFDDIKTLYDLDAPETGHTKVEQTYSDYRKGDKAKLDSLAYLALNVVYLYALPLATLRAEPNAGAGLRVAGNGVAAEFSGTQDWQKFSYPFRVQEGGTTVSAVCELRASRGEAWFDTSSLRIVKIR